MTEHDSATIQRIHEELHSHLPPEPALRVKAIESLLLEKGMVDPRAVDTWVQVYTEEIGPKRGAQIIARAWTDPSYRERLLADGSAAVEEFGVARAHLKAVENTDKIHNLVVCTLCSCYPVSVIGIPPNWYKTAAYRARAVREPRAVLAEFGTHLPDDVTVRVWDSTSEVRYFTVPRRPAGTEHLGEEELRGLVTRDSLVGARTLG